MNAVERIGKCIALVTAFLCASASADYVVLQSNSEDFAPGAIIADAESLKLRGDTQLVLLSESGETLSLGGDSGQEPVSTSNEDLKLMLTNLVQHKRDEHISLGGTRAGIGIGIGSKTEGNAPVFSLDPFISGIQCLVNEISVQVYRGDTRNALELKVLKAGTRETGAIRWNEGQHEAGWPDEIPIEEGGHYTIKREGYMENSVVQLESIPKVSIDSKSTAVAWLAAKKCIPQAERLLNMLRSR